MHLPRILRRFLIHRQRQGRLSMARSQNVGAGTRIAKTVQVLGWNVVRIGRHCLICDHTLINPRNCPGDDIRIRIGDFCLIGQRNFLSPGALLTINSYCLTGPDCSFLGSDHSHETPFVPYAASGNTAGGEIHIGPNCWLGSRVTVLKGVTIGQGSIIGASAVVTQDVPAFSIAVGQPARVVRRFDVATRSWTEPINFGPESEARIPTEQDYLAELRRTKVSLPAAAIGIEAGDWL